MHFLGTVIGPETESEVDDALARWDENKDVEPYVVEYREDFLERAREWASRRPDVDGSDEDALLGRFALYTGAELDEDGNEVSTMPEDAFYDWYELGGRWSGETASLQGLTAHDAAVRAPMSGWIVVDGHAVRTATLILSGMVGALVLAVFIMGGYEQVWWAGLIALAGWPLLFVPRFVREDRRWRKERK